MGITDALCQYLQHKSQDILNAMNLVSSTKTILRNLRENGWDDFIVDVKVFCEKNEVKIPDMNAQYNSRRFRASRENITNEHHYRMDIFVATIDSELEEISERFNEESIELLCLSKAFDPKNGYSSFNIDDICNLAKKFDPIDFTELELTLLRYQLQHYKIDVNFFENMSRISDICQGLITTNKAETFYLIDRLMHLVLTLPVSTATTQRSFSAMKLIKTRLRSKMEDEFLANCMLLFIERGIAQKIDNDLVIDEFYAVKNRRAQLN